MNTIADMSGDLLVTVVIPYYRHKAFIERCLYSIVQQSYQNIEVVIIDDASPDQSSEFVQQLCNKADLQARFSGKLTFIGLQKNVGAHAAINYGISHAQGDIIAIINSDDMYHPNRVEFMLEEMKRQAGSFVFSKVKYIDDEDNDVTIIHDTATNFRMLQERVKDFPTVGFGCLAFNFGISTGNYMFTKALYEKVGKFKSYLYCHDWDFLLRVIQKVEPIFLQEDLYYYRFHGKNSFESLQHVGIDECSQIIQSYFSDVCRRKTENPLAPSKYNWPGYFEMFLKLRRYVDLYKMSVYF
jgi:glycosyltransferase involved in cell wall biosynthesis